MSENTPLLSVLVPVYNHAPWIETCIRSILMQQTDFSFEVLIADDASTDGSLEILKRMEKEPGWPPYFHIIYRKNNIGMFRNGEDLYCRARGRYLIVLEGDDYWTFEGKLKAQVDFLEAHPEYTACAHRVTLVSREGRILYRYPECFHRHYRFPDWCLGFLPGQTGTLLFRNGILNSSFSIPEGYPRDQVKAFLLVTQGKVACFPQKWSAYRYHPEDGSSFSGREKVPWSCRKDFYREAREYLKKRKPASGASCALLSLRAFADCLICRIRETF